MGKSGVWIEEPRQNTDPQFDQGITKSKGSLSKNTVFCFKHIHRKYDAEKLCGRKVENKMIKSFIKKIQKISQLKIAQVMSDNKFACGYELMPIGALKRDIPSTVTEDIEEVNVFRFGGREGRIIGYYTGGNIFHILFIDPHLELYEHGK